jgi:hypothetical protein
LSTISDTLWTIVRWTVPITVAGVIAAAAIGSSRLGEEVRARVELRLREAFPSIDVQVQSAQVVEGEGIVVRGVSFAAPELPQAIRTILHVEEVRLACSTSLSDLASGRIEIAHVRVRRPVVHAVRLEGKAWTIARLLGRGQPSAPPPLVIEDATVLVEDASSAVRTSLRRIHAEVAVEPATATIAIRGSMSGDLFSEGGFQGRVGLADGGFDLAGTIGSFELSESVVAMVTAGTSGSAAGSAGAAALDWARGFRGRCDLEWRARGNRSDLAAVDYEVTGRVEAGRYEHGSLPFAVSDIAASFTAGPSGGQISELRAHSGTTLLKGSARWSRWDPATDFELVVDAERLLVGRHWEPLLPEPTAAQWRKLLPAGEVDVRAQVVRKESRIEPKVSLRCRNVSITHYRFPYRLDRTVGTVVLDGSSLTLHLTGQAGSHPVQVDGSFQDMGSGGRGVLEVRADDMGIDEGLLAAMPPRSADIVRALRASGRFGFVFRHERSPDLEAGHANSLGIRLAQCSMAYAGFPYPLSGVSGQVHMRDGRWLIRDVSGSNDSGVVRCSGELEPLPDGDGQLELRLTGERMVLEDELRDSLPGSMRRIWNDVDPRGLVDVKATVRHRVKARSTDVEMEATPSGDTVSIEPSWFPYRLERLTGKLLWHKGLMRFEGIRGVHARTTVATEGTCRFQPDGGWHVAFTKLSADRFRTDHELLTALPDGLQEAIQSVRPRGMMSLAGSLDIYSTPATPAAEVQAASTAPPEPPGRVSAAWDMHLDIEQGTLDVGAPLEHVHGGVHIVGQSDGRRWQSTGELAIDSLIYRGVQLTGVTGPLSVDPEGLRIGAAAAPSATARGRRLVARVAGGTLQADGVVASGPSGSFRMSAEVSDADLARLSAEWLGTSHRHRGRVQGAIDISGSRAGSHSLSGKGNLRLRDADIYELPLVLALLKMLRVKAPDRNAFGSSFVDFRVEGPRFYLDNIELSGDAISLVGNGELDFDGNTHMTFRSIMGDSQLQLPVMKRMLGGASGQFMLIHVDGTLADPKMTSEAFPTLNAAIQKLQSQRGERRAALGLDGIGPSNVQ